MLDPAKSCVDGNTHGCSVDAVLNTCTRLKRAQRPQRECCAFVLERLADHARQPALRATATLKRAARPKWSVHPRNRVRSRRTDHDSTPKLALTFPSVPECRWLRQLSALVVPLLAEAAIVKSELVVPDNPEGTRMNELNKTPTHDEIIRREAFDHLRRVLDDAPRPRHAEPADWRRIEAAYHGWRDSLRRGELQGFRSEQQGLRANVIQAFEASPQALVLDAVERHRGHFYNMRRVTSGADAARERNRKAADPAGYRAAATERQRDHRARLRQAALEATRDLEGHDFDLSGDNGRIDQRRWKAPEAIA
jgi:hypothetical protein